MFILGRFVPPAFSVDLGLADSVITLPVFLSLAPFSFWIPSLYLFGVPHWSSCGLASGHSSLHISDLTFGLDYSLCGLSIYSVHWLTECQCNDIQLWCLLLDCLPSDLILGGFYTIILLMSVFVNSASSFYKCCQSLCCSAVMADCIVFHNVNELTIFLFFWFVPNTAHQHLNLPNSYRWIHSDVCTFLVLWASEFCWHGIVLHWALFQLLCCMRWDHMCTQQHSAVCVLSFCMMHTYHLYGNKTNHVFTCVAPHTITAICIASCCVFDNQNWICQPMMLVSFEMHAARCLCSASSWSKLQQLSVIWTQSSLAT